MQKENPWSDLLLLFGLMLLFTFATQILAVLAGLLLGGDIQDIGSMIRDVNGEMNFFGYLFMASGTIGTFLLPAYLFQKRKPQYDLSLCTAKLDWKSFAGPVLFLLAFAPLMSLIGDWNMKMQLPGEAEALESWMRTQEDSMAELVSGMVMVTSWDKLMLNILVVGLLPAIGEEFFFRGAMQNIFQRILKNEHATIWIVGIVFSTIHFQFYGFFPRLLLGVTFGYIVVWTGSIWPAVLAHFINNASVTVIAFYYAGQGKTYADLMEIDSYAGIMYLGSFILSIIIAMVFYRYAKNKRLHGKRMG